MTTSPEDSALPGFLNDGGQSLCPAIYCFSLNGHNVCFSFFILRQMGFKKDFLYYLIGFWGTPGSAQVLLMVQ